MSNVVGDVPFGNPPINLPICQGVYDLDVPWNTQKPSANNETARSTHAAVARKQGGRSNQDKGEECRIGFWARLRFLFDPRSLPEPLVKNLSTEDQYSPIKAPAEDDWKAYGYWACPRVNTINVNNRTIGSISPGQVDVEAVFHSLLGPNDSPHPERWIPGLVHPALPPRTTLWDDAEPLPFVWQYHLNPFLQHRAVGYSPIYFHIGGSSLAVYHRLPLLRGFAVPLWPEEFAQPATYPFLTEMHINSIADDDSAMPFPWPIIVRNPGGLLIRDIFNALSDNFAQYVGQEEFMRWTEERRRAVEHAYRGRIAMPIYSLDPVNIPPFRDNTGLRRVDYLGERVLFRGLEASPEKDGTWIMFLGPM